ncbi:uncharacterized protein DFL_006729 [Arthrobotrys flagrans]|uniref:Uncharacterized protein n=1 Tax=Arthrobotrys flagrans TaxID=97331 RepID=A0A436ZTN6_ARTFL|nr:hypothetical protein DFL_006729 [Arthrobotrys flagrans]
MPLPDADKKLAAIKKLSELSYNSKKAGSNEDRGWNGVTKYISNARDILKVLGPDYDEAVALGVVRGINRGELKETIAAIMWDKEWKLETVIKILKAVIQKEIWEPTVLN